MVDIVGQNRHEESIYNENVKIHVGDGISEKRDDISLSLSFPISLP